MYKQLCIIIFFWCSWLTGLANFSGATNTPPSNTDKRLTVNGYVKDASSGEELIGVSVYVQEAQSGTTTNLYGFYSLSLEPGKYTLVFSYVGYHTLTKAIELKENKTLNIELASSDINLEEVVVTADKPINNVEVVQMSAIKMDIVEVKKMPQLFGEVDIVRSIQLLPGVTTVGEGATGFNVRGGNVDQNLILLDEAPVYNASHVLGFFSVFNADAIKDVNLQKGAIDAMYGGRLSSVLDIRQKEGNAKKFSGTGGIGLISSRLMLEGPFKKDKSSFMLAGRRSYADIFTALSADENVKDSRAYFYDLNAKINYTINDKNKVYLSGYFGRDVLGFGEDAKFDWGNKTATVRWNHIFGEKIFTNFTGVVSDYDYSLRAEDGEQKFDWVSSILNYNVKADASYFITPKHTVNFGLSSLYYGFKPGEVSFTTTTKEESTLNLTEKHALESAVYASFEHEVSPKIKFTYGLRYSLFQNLGKTQEYTYLNNDPTTEVTLDTLRYGSGEVINTFGNLEPRFGARFTLNEQSSIKLSYNRMAQYIHLVSNTTASLPIDIWTPAGTHIKPAKADQLALGYFRNVADNKIEISAEAYYKKFYDLLDFKDGAELIFREQLETELLTGKGRAYGLELMVRKQSGKLTGWVSYVLSRTERQVDGINNGEYYPANYDKPHDLTIVGTYQLNDRWSFGANFAYMTGRPITYPNARYVWEGVVVPNYDNRNGARIPDYHRLDLSATYDVPKKIGRKWESSWTFALYNAYGRRNPYSVFFKQNKENPSVTEAVRYSVIGIPVPSVTYNFKF